MGRVSADNTVSPRLLDVLQLMADDNASLVVSLAAHKGLVKFLLRGGVLGALGSILGSSSSLQPKSAARASVALRCLSASPAVRFELGTAPAAPLLRSVVEQA